MNSAGLLDLLAIILARSEDGVADCEGDARKLLNLYKPARLINLDSKHLRDTSGLEKFEVLQRLAAIEIGRRAAMADHGDTVLLADSAKVAEHFASLRDEIQEHFCAAYLDSKGAILSTKTIHIGTVNMSLVGPREVFREAVREGAASIIVVHNHPSGDTTPSPEDIAVTQKLAEVGELLDIPLLDHLIIGRDKEGRDDYASLQELGHI
ncbi:MAG: DNA repair protein RadC [Armatimonadetes bacterium]|nr:DNA repair protein RadC [Armatimonadota bacterium]